MLCLSLSFHFNSVQQKYIYAMYAVHAHEFSDWLQGDLKHVCCVLTAHILLISLDIHNLNEILFEIFHEENMLQT